MNTNDIPKYAFSLPVRFADTDAQTHVFFGNYFTYFDEAYMGYLAEIGFSWGQMAEQNLETYYVSADCEFLGRAYYGDVLNVHTEFTKLGTSSLVLALIIINAGTGSTVARGHLTAVMINTRSGKSTPIPESFREAVDRYQKCL